MGRAWLGLIMLLGGWAVAQTLVSAPAQAQLDPHLHPYYYSETCPDLFPIVARYLLSAIQNETRIAASLLRVHFHDCFVQGCDASVLLDGDGTEKDTPPNRHSLRGFEVLDTIKAALEEACPNVVSCADVVALASFFGIVLTGGPIWVIPLGRLDSRAPSATLVSNLAGPASDISHLLERWANVGLDATDLVALSGGHTIGLARCITFSAVEDPDPSLDIFRFGPQDRLYNFSGTNEPDPSLNSSYLAVLQQLCPRNATVDQLNATTGMDRGTSGTFDNSYYKRFRTSEQLFSSDDALYNHNNDTRQLVETYADNQTRFFVDFAQSMIHMGNLNNASGPQEVRTNCRVVNSDSTIAQTSRKETTPAKVFKPLSREEEETFVDEIRRVVERVKAEYLADYLGRVVEDGEFRSSHSSS